MSCIDAVFQMLQSQVLGQDIDITSRISRFFVGHPLPPHVYPHMTLPGPPPLFLHTTSDQKLEAGTAWERG